jgi:hypothetical protein
MFLYYFLNFLNEYVAEYSNKRKNGLLWKSVHKDVGDGGVGG